MQVHTDLSELPNFQHTALTIGSFDGVHQGHGFILRQVVALADSVGGESLLITFDPHPRQVLIPDDGKDLELITSTQEKIELLRPYGLDHVVLVPFTKAFSQQSPDTYLHEFLVKKFNPQFIVVGYDHRFGKNRAGTTAFLRRYEVAAQFKVIEIGEQQVRKIIVSSTKIRRAIRMGNLAEANDLLGHPFPLSGKVVKGEGIGRRLGFPTANLQIEEPDKLIPPDGVYAVWVHIRDQVHGGMLYIGHRPTLPELPDHTIEVNIFDWDEDLYGENIQLSIMQRTRGDETFSTLEALRKQLIQDRKDCLTVLVQKPYSQ